VRLYTTLAFQFTIVGLALGVDVMITISGEKMAFFLKNNVMLKIYAKTSSSFSTKRHFCENFLKIITSVPAFGFGWEHESAFFHG
jgi:hypothetical protein